MAEFLGDLKRTDYCGKVGESQVGKKLVVTGWAAKRRDLGGLIFVDLRDRSGILQVVFDASIAGEEVFDKAESIRSEYVLAIEGTLRLRDEAAVNPKIATGKVELVAKTLKILSDADTPPFAIEDNSATNEAVRLKYRYLDLRNSSYQERFRLRSDVCRVIRDYMLGHDFLEIETPFLGKSTPEGARDYLVPSRVHPGEFYALPQSPQLYKQLLMISGFDRYFQIARCFRDEDLRANRQPEFTQVDMEMSFVDDEEDVMGVAEGLIRRVFKDCINYDLPEKIRRMTWQEAMDRFGSDKPDTRFGLELTDISDIVDNCGFQVFTGAIKAGGSVRLINAKGFGKILSRRDIDALGEFVKTYKAKGLAWISVKEDGLQSAITKFLDEDTVNAILKRANAEVGDILFFCADAKNEVVYASLGALRLHLAEKANLIDKMRLRRIVGNRIPDVRVQRRRKTARRRSSPVHQSQNRRLAACRNRTAQSPRKGVRSRYQRSGGGRRKYQNPLARSSEENVQRARIYRRADSGSLRILRRRVQLRNASARRTRVRTRPPYYAFKQDGQHQGRYRVPEGSERFRPYDRRSERGRAEAT